MQRGDISHHRLLLSPDPHLYPFPCWLIHYTVIAMAPAAAAAAAGLLSQMRCRNVTRRGIGAALDVCMEQSCTCQILEGNQSLKRLWR